MKRRFIHSFTRASARALVPAATVLVLASCSTFGNKGAGAAIGAAAGAVAGAVIGHQLGSTTKGAIAGAVVGGATGVVIGNQMDQQAKELQQAIPGATIERVGEGIAVTFASSMLYGFDSDVVLPDAAANLRSLGASLGRFPNTDILIVGHTDAVGSTTYNQALSERRAAAAAHYLVNQGVTTGRVRTSGRGEMDPVATNDTEAGRQTNRRVEIAIVANAASRKAGN